MGDHRLNVEISLTGIDGKQVEIDWWLNWRPDMPERLYIELVKKAKESGLDVEDRTYLFDGGYEL